LDIFGEYVERFKFYENLKRLKGTLDKDLCIFVIISRRIILKMGNTAVKVCRGNKNAHFMFKNAFPEVIWKHVVETSHG
jgi:hypothetical protein